MNRKRYSYRDDGKYRISVDATAQVLALRATRNEATAFATSAVQQWHMSIRIEVRTAKDEPYTLLAIIPF